MEQLFLCWMNPEFLRYPPMFKENVKDLSFSPDNCNYLIVRQLLSVSGNVTCALASTQAYKDQYRSEKKKQPLLPFVRYITESGSCSPPRVLMLLSIKAHSGSGSGSHLCRGRQEKVPRILLPHPHPTPTQNVPFFYFFSPPPLLPT